MRSSMTVLGFVIASGGCGFQGPAAEIDAPPAVEPCTTFSSQLDTCALTLDADLTVSGMSSYDTGTHELRINGTVTPAAHMTVTSKAGDVDALLVRNVTISAGAGLRVTGPLPFAIVAGGSVTVEDAASIDVGHGGAGARTSCGSPPTPGEDNSGGAAGGGGGGYGAAGGKGGDGNADGKHSAGGMPGGALAMPAGPLGGCPGAHGGAGVLPGGVGGAGGLGGGALYVVTAERISVGNGAALTAGGGGGGGGGQLGGTGDAGGGGGGSGGMILLESPHVVGPQARIAANGGGGGEGSDVSAAGDLGDDGGTSTSRASGGSGKSSGGTDGGRGGSQEGMTGEMPGSPLNGGGGGGGGGVGFIHIVSPDAQLGTVSPAAK